MNTDNEKSSDRLIQENRRITLKMNYTFVAILILTTYLLQRSLTDIARVTPNILMWSSSIQISLMGLRFSYVTMTLVWPAVLGILCFAYRIAILRKLVLLSFLKTEWRATTGYNEIFLSESIIGRELVQPFQRFIWSILSIIPVISIGTHLIGGTSNLILLKRMIIPESFGQYWPAQWLLVAAIILFCSCVFGMWSAVRVYTSMIRLRQSLEECPGYHQQWENQPIIASHSSVEYEQNKQVKKISHTKWEVFLSAKKLNKDGRVARDNIIAEELYDFLGNKGFQVFFSCRSLEELGASAFKGAIDAALDECIILIVVGTSVENMNSDWMKYEWDSFLNDILSGIKPQGRIFVYLDRVSIRELPRALRQTQAFQHGIQEMERLYNFVKKSLPDHSPG